MVEIKMLKIVRALFTKIKRLIYYTLSEENLDKIIKRKESEYADYTILENQQKEDMTEELLELGCDEETIEEIIETTQRNEDDEQNIIHAKSTKTNR